MMKRVLSLFVALSLMLCVFNVGYVFAEGEDSALTEVIDEQITEEQPEPTAEEALPTSTPEFTDEPVGEDENENIEDENVGDANADDASYEVVQVPTGEYAAINIAARDLEVYVTDGTNPISGAAVTVGGQTVISDANGYAVFSDIPTADTHYDLIVNCEYGQKTESILLPKTEVMDSATADVPIANATVSYWQPDIEEEDGVSALSATALYYEEWYSVVSRVDDPKFIDEYNGKIYVYGDNFRVYNPDGETWTDLTDLYGGDEMIRCGDSFYLYSASWSADGDYYWDASYSLYRYNISNNSWTTVDTGSGGMFDPAVTVCGDKIYFSGGYQVIYDMYVKETRYDVSYFDTSDNSWSQYYNVLSGGGDIIAVLCEESGDYYNDIFYIDDSYVIRFDTETDTFTTIGYINRSYSLCYDAVYKNGSIYLVGRTSNEEYDIVQYNVAASGWSTLVTLSAAETFTMIEYNNKLFISGSDTDETVFYTYDMLTGNIKYQYLHYAILSHCAVEYDGKIYLVANNGTLAVHDALLSNIFISPDLTLAVDGIAHSVYVKNGDVYTRGDNTYGQLGYGNNNSSETFIKVNGNWDDKMIVKVAAGADTTFALTEDNTLYGWGRNDKYQLGVGNNININTPVQIMTDVADVSAGYEHTLVLKTNGDVYGFGDNTYGQLASDGTSIHTPVKVYSNAVSIGTGDYHSLVIDNLNSLYTTGKNDNGQLGIGNTDNQNNFNLAMSNVKKAAGGYNHTVALDIVGNVYTCGDNRSLQLGRTVSSYSNSFALTDTATDVWAGANSTAYLKNGKLYQCGSREYTLRKDILHQ